MMRSGPPSRGALRGRARGWVGAIAIVGAAAGPLPGCSVYKRECKQVVCEDGGTDGGTGACATERGVRLLLDNFAAPSFAFEQVRATDGTALVPAVFNWRAPSRATEVTCAVFTSSPMFSCYGMTNFHEAVALYDSRTFAGNEPREGTFDLSAARSQDVTPSPDYRAAGCWAYSLVDVVGATPLIELAASDPAGDGRP